MANNKTKILLAVLVAIGLPVGGYFAGKYSQPAKVVVKTEVKEVVKEVVKKDVVIVEREIIRPDGTVERERIEIDRSQYEREQKKDEVSKTETTKRANYRAAAIVGADFRSLQPVYGASIDARVFGPVSVGAWGMTNGTAGITVGIEF
jgi:hypothetical protein